MFIICCRRLLVRTLFLNMLHVARAFLTATAPVTRRHSPVYRRDPTWTFSRVLAFSFVFVSLSCYCQCAKASSDHGGAHNYHPRDSSLPKTTREASSQNKRFGWLKVKPLWMDIEKSCFARTCIAPYAVQVISIEPTINHTAMFDMDIDIPMPPVDMYFPTPPFKPRPFRKPAEAGYGDQEMAFTMANFSVGLFGVDPTYRFPRHCHSMIENTASFTFVLSSGHGRNRRPPIIPPPSIISFGADCLNLTFQIFVIPAMPESGPGDAKGHSEHGPESADSLNLLGAAVAASDAALNVRTPVPMWIVAILAGVNAALIFAVVALVWHIALSAKKKRNKRLRRQRSSAASSATTTTNSYVPSCTTPMNRRMTPPLPPPPLRPPPSRAVADHDQTEPKYDIPWGESKYDRANGTHDKYKITFNTLPHRPRDPQFFSYYFSADEHLPAPVIMSASGEVNCNDRPKPLRRTTTPSIVTTMR